jgi:hypothetical protein
MPVATYSAAIHSSSAVCSRKPESSSATTTTTKRGGARSRSARSAASFCSPLSRHVSTKTCA